MNRPAARRWGFILAALLIGATTATAQGFQVGDVKWFGAMAGGPVLGVILGLVRQPMTATRVPASMLWCAIGVLALTAMGAECAVCVFVP